ncbi:aminoimidazole riboside kinase [Salmonella enterica subsp. enterica serovar Java]|uniref:Aminoimidazole riboside kinase n=4 Tax=Salmonella enterica TaxID=28901 RepID=A0A3R0UAJ9_SALER|nr:aminoimidazole riboside kinase [Salmonella enterica subsp. enterica serovar Java]EAO1479292.1 aminoimidazole riboside kinase [Salmonella enterica]ECA3791094.1 aminoimidazole riboside kinase [Salmonella enterica subsp. enterica serovar Aqua]EBR8574836.1 aminoimidazole riboside kinase [Salmonella enterica subsp. enterica serovar Java]ECH1168680.1 aminoimidazole riboside kinase [Salmonella enterica subsp. enterica serovar Aqua]
MKHLNKIWVIGDASVDLVPERADSYLKCPGGASANVAVCVARLGGDCGFIGCLGDDDAGRFLRQTLAQNGVDVTSLRLDPQQTSAVLIVNLTPEGERSFTYLVHPGADTFVSTQDLPAFGTSEWFYFSSIGLTDSPAREACLEGARRMKAAGGHVMFDVNLRVSMWRDINEIAPLLAESIALASVCKVSADELCWLGKVRHWQEARYLMRELGCETSVISLGEDGALLVTPEGEFTFPAPKISVVDTTGAGDAFVGGLLYTLSQAASWDRRLLSEAIGNANACGAMAVTAKGAMTALPYPEQLAAFRVSHPLKKSC